MLTMCGPTQCGKTHLIVKIIDNIDDVIEPPPDKLLYLYTAGQTSYDDIKQIVRKNAPTSALKSCEFINCNNGIPSIASLKSRLGTATLLILDDLMIIAASNKENMEKLNNLASRDSHHFNTSVIFVCQNLNYGNGIT
jgi:DNA replication protein DnaC